MFLVPASQVLETVIELTENTDTELNTVSSDDEYKLLDQEKTLNSALKLKVKTLQETIKNIRFSRESNERTLKTSIHETHRKTLIHEKEILELQHTFLTLQETAHSAKEYEKKYKEFTIKRQAATKQLKNTPQKSRPLAEDELDRLVQLKLRKLGVPGLLHKEEQNVYSLGKHKVFLEFRDHTLLCKLGKSYKTFDDYITLYREELTSLNPLKRHLNF